MDPDLIQGNTWDPTAVDDAVARLWTLAERPTAIFAASDNLAFLAQLIRRATA